MRGGETPVLVVGKPVVQARPARLRGKRAQAREAVGPARIGSRRIGERRKPGAVVDAERLGDVGRDPAEAARQVDRMPVLDGDQRFLHEPGNLALEATAFAAEQHAALRVRRHVAAHSSERAPAQRDRLPRRTEAQIPEPHDPSPKKGSPDRTCARRALLRKIPCRAVPIYEKPSRLDNIGAFPRPAEPCNFRLSAV